MSALQFFLVILAVLCFLAGWKHAHRHPWDGKLHGWRLDSSVAHSSRRYRYWPKPTHAPDGWKRPESSRMLRSYCLRCGKWPFTGPELMYTKTNGFMFICSLCALHSQTSYKELCRYAHIIVDIKIAQNFDPRFVHLQLQLPITDFFEMWTGAQASLEKLERDRG